jgi:hypothetical protein
MLVGGGGGKQIKLRIEGRENIYLGMVAYLGVPLNLKINETHILIRLCTDVYSTELVIRLSFSKTSEFGGANLQYHLFMLI